MDLDLQASAAAWADSRVADAESPALAAARVAHLVLVPCRASILDLRAVAASQTIAQLAGRGFARRRDADYPLRHMGSRSHQCASAPALTSLALRGPLQGGRAASLQDGNETTFAW